MSEKFTPLAVPDMLPPSRRSRIEAYIADEADQTSRELACDLLVPGKNLERTVAIIPVAAHTESKRIVPAMAEYAKQTDCEPFSVCLFLNSPFSAKDKTVAKSFQAVLKARELFPHLDIRVTEMEYETPVIGQVRKDMWDAVTRLAYANGHYDFPGNETIGINHDIDVEKMGRHYMRNIQNYYARKQARSARRIYPDVPLPSRYTQVKHTYPFETHPNIAKVILWNDYAYRQASKNGVYEAGLVIPLSYYAQQKGFSPDDVTHETSPLCPLDISGIPGTVLDTSPRRFITRIGQHGLSEVWTKDSFGHDDPCRKQTRKIPDITENRVEDVLFDQLDTTSWLFCRTEVMRAIRQYDQSRPYESGKSDASRNPVDVELVLRQACESPLKFQRTMMQRLVGASTLSSLIDERYLTEFAGSLVDSFTN